MTEYGRGPGSEPWHPEDPLYGEPGWDGQQAHQGQPAYGGQPQHHHYPQQSQQQEYGDWTDGQAQQYDPQQYDPQQYDQQQYHQQQYGHQYEQQQYEQQQYDPQQYDQRYAQQGQQGYHEGGWDGTGTAAHVPYAADPGDPYGQQAAAYGAQQPDFYGTPDAYPPPEPPARRRAEPETVPEPEPESESESESEQKPDERIDWDPGPEQQDEHPFFADGGGGSPDDGSDEDDDDPEGRGGRRGRGGRGGVEGGKTAKGKKKSRNGCACLIVALVFVGGIGGVGYVGYHFYQNRYSTAPDYSGGGTSTVSVEIPKGAGGAAIGRELKKAGVVKSVDAFVSAFTSNSRAGSIQAGAYVLKKEMSAKSAVDMMLDPTSQANVVVAEGQRNVEVYKRIDAKLGLSAGATRKIAEKDYKNLGLPDWANDNKEIKDPLEGFLFPGTYPAAKGMKPESILKAMVARADTAYKKYDLEGKAENFKLDNPLQLLTVASLVQAEG
ncbi:endolytic transglycosylase MltG, partial [Streptomyces sp. NPDC002920]